MCQTCLKDGQFDRHTNHRFPPRPPKPPREHGTYRGCKQHWSRGESLCSDCTIYYETRHLRRTATIPAVRVEESLLENLRSVAEMDRITLSDVVREALVAHIRRYGIDPPEAD